MIETKSPKSPLEGVTIEVMAEAMNCPVEMLYTKKRRSTAQVAMARSAIVMFLILESEYTKEEAAQAVGIDRSSTFRIVNRHLKISTASSTLSHFDDDYYQRYAEGVSEVKRRLFDANIPCVAGHASSILAEIHRRYMTEQ